MILLINFYFDLVSIKHIKNQTNFNLFKNNLESNFLIKQYIPKSFDKIALHVVAELQIDSNKLQISCERLKRIVAISLI